MVEIMDMPDIEAGEINRRINELPDILVGFPQQPRQVRVITRVAWLLLIAAMFWPLLVWLGLPLACFKTPALWLAAAMLLCFVPYLVWSLFQLYRHFKQGVTGFFLQFDHDLPELRDVTSWLANYPEIELQRSLAEVQFHHGQLEEKLRLVLGGMEKLGVLPLVVAIALAVANGHVPAMVPLWVWLFGILGALLWGMGWVAARFRLRLKLIAHLLEQALVMRKAMVNNRDAGD